MKKQVAFILSTVSCLLFLVFLILGILAFAIDLLPMPVGIVFIILSVLFLLAGCYFTLIYSKNKKSESNSIKIIKPRKRKTKSPTCTIQISTEYLVKDKYTKEEAEATIKQLYSLHENDGFSLQDFEFIKAKIESRIVDK